MNSKSVLDHINDIPVPRRNNSLPDKLREGMRIKEKLNIVHNFTLKFTNTLYFRGRKNYVKTHFLCEILSIL